MSYANKINNVYGLPQKIGTIDKKSCHEAWFFCAEKLCQDMNGADCQFLALSCLFLKDMINSKSEECIRMT